MRRARGIFRAALRSFPAHLRERLGDEMVHAFEERYRRRRVEGRAAALGYLVRATADALVAGLGERARHARGGGIIDHRPRGGGGMTRELWTDVRVALRVLGRSPGFAAAAILVLALGIGANAAIFSAVKATLLTPPPFPEPERLVLLDLTVADVGGPEPPRPQPWSYPKFRVLAETEGRLADPVAAYTLRNTFTLTVRGEALRIRAEVITPDYFEVLAVAPALGRDFADADDRPESEASAVLGHTLWLERFGGDPGVVGGTLVLNDRPLTVVGVAPAGFRGLSGNADLWLPVHTAASLVAPFLVTGARAHWLQAVGRLPAGGSLEALDAHMRAVGAAVEAAYPDPDPTEARAGGARSLEEARTNEEARRSLLILSAAAVLLLLVACANLAGLLVARAGTRGRETAIRIAIGAGRWRVVRGALVESLILAVAGGALASFVALVGVDALAAAWPDRFLDGGWNLRFADPTAMGVDAGVLAFASALALLTGILSGLLPAVAAAGRDPGRDLRAGGAVGPGRRPRGRPGVRGTLVAAEIAVSLVLIVGAGLLFRSLGELQAVDRGVSVRSLLVFEYDIPRTSRWAEDPAAFHRAYLERLRALPGVSAATLACAPPLGGHCMITQMRFAGATAYVDGSRPSVGVDYVDHDFFETLGIPLVAGRAFGEQDRAGSPLVVVLNETAARTFFPDGDAVGSRVSMGASPAAETTDGVEVIGVVGDVLYDTPEQGVMPEAYFTMAQEPGPSRIFVRSEGEPLALVGPARTALAELDPGLPLFGVRTLDDLEAGATADTRVLGGLLAVFAGLALLLAATGVWAVVAHGVSRRTRELGLRVALGARPSEVVGLVVRQGVAIALAGTVLGAALAWAASRVLRGMLYGVEPTDPVAFAGGALFLLAVSVVAAWLPARRATRVDPIEALRAD